MDDSLDLTPVFEFLDSFDANPPPPEPQQLVVVPAVASLKPLRWRESGYSTMIARRRRSELRALKEQARELTAKLEVMKRARASGRRQHSTTELSHQQDEPGANKELRARLEAEETNQQLRARLAGLQRLREKLRRVIVKHQRLELERGDVLLEIKTATVLSRQVALSQASRMLDAMISEADAVFASSPLLPLDAVSSSSLTSSLSSDRCEIRSTVAASCSVTMASSLLWGKPPGDHPPPLVNDTALDGNEYRWEMTMSLESQDLRLYLQHFGRRVVDPMTDRVLLAVFTLVRIPAVSNDVLLWEKYWTSIAHSIELGGSGSISHGCYHIHGGFTSSSEDSGLQALQTSVKHSLVMLTRQNTSTLQDWLLHGGQVML